MDWSNPLIYIIPGIAALSGIIYLARWMGSKDQFVKIIGDAINEIRDDIKKIFERLPEPVLSKSSPLRLTDLGQSISDFLEAATWAEKTSKEIADEVQDKQPYGIQNYCFEFVNRTEILPDELNRKIQESAYNNGIKVDQVKEVLAIELRDALLRIHGLESPESD